ncbi:hypothetical protein [Ralstonia pseudosolanacearum]|uniref:hypothetical protein n=1 Tax=Ralstonia pseudosolanacearum TaxID=1310165 RepID=UPI0008DB0EE7|nr:hypothetical protein [Ralstonia pseudosolanacearum]MCL1618340.1 hypothetical protein [Ralstonia pseudosolanacearum CaRs-Mep]
MPTYLVMTPLELGGDERVEAGETVDLKVKDARELLAIGAISKDLPEPAPAVAPASKPTSTPAPAPAPASASASASASDASSESTTGAGSQADASQTGTEQSTTPPAA